MSELATEDRQLIQINLSNTTYENICDDKFLLSDIPELIQAIKSGEPVEDDNRKSSTSAEDIRILKTSEILIGDQLSFPIGAKIYTATAVKKEANGGMLFVFNTIVGTSIFDSLMPPKFSIKMYQMSGIG